MKSGDTARPLNGDRTQLWLPLLRTLTDDIPDWCVWKNAESAFHGTGDIDAAALDSSWRSVEEAFVEWARDHGLGPVVVCPHIPGGLNLVAVPTGATHLLEMGVKARRIFRGGTLFTHEDLQPLMTMDPLGFRRLRPGAEGLFKLALNGLRWDGRPNEEGLRTKNVRALLARDPEGVAAAAAVFGGAARSAIAGAEAAAAGGWDRRAMLAVQWAALRRALSEPRVLAARVRFRLVTRSRCSLVKVLLGHARRIPADRDEWLRRVRREHQVYE